MSFKFRGKKLYVFLFSFVLASSAATATAATYFDRIAKTNSLDPSNYMFKTDDGIALTLPIDKENPISIIMDNIPEEDKITIKNAINRLDSISTNLNYTILNNDNMQIKNKIYICDGEIKDGVLGQANFSFDKRTAKINYPVYITIDLDKCHKLISSETGENAVAAIAKHELAHAHGFADLYSEELKNESIMWHEINLDDYTKSDEERIRKVYGGVSEVINDFESVALLDEIKSGETLEYSLKDSGLLNLTHSDIFGQVFEPNKILVMPNVKEKELYDDNANQREF